MNAELGVDGSDFLGFPEVPPRFQTKSKKSNLGICRHGRRRLIFSEGALSARRENFSGPRSNECAGTRGVRREPCHETIMSENNSTDVRAASVVVMRPVPPERSLPMR